MKEPGGLGGVVHAGPPLAALAAREASGLRGDLAGFDTFVTRAKGDASLLLLPYSFAPTGGEDGRRPDEGVSPREKSIAVARGETPSPCPLPQRGRGEKGEKWQIGFDQTGVAIRHRLHEAFRTRAFARQRGNPGHIDLLDEPHLRAA